MPRRMLNPDAKKVIDARMPMRCQVDMKDAGTGLFACMPGLRAGVFSI